MTGEVGLHLATVLSGLSAGMQIFVGSSLAALQIHLP